MVCFEITYKSSNNDSIYFMDDKYIIFVATAAKTRFPLYAKGTDQEKEIELATNTAYALFGISQWNMDMVKTNISEIKEFILSKFTSASDITFEEIYINQFIVACQKEYSLCNIDLLNKSNYIDDRIFVNKLNRIIEYNTAEDRFNNKSIYLQEAYGNSGINKNNNDIINDAKKYSLQLYDELIRIAESHNDYYLGSPFIYLLKGVNHDDLVASLYLNNRAISKYTHKITNFSQENYIINDAITFCNIKINSECITLNAFNDNKLFFNNSNDHIDLSRLTDIISNSSTANIIIDNIYSDEKLHAITKHLASRGIYNFVVIRDDKAEVKEYPSIIKEYLESKYNITERKYINKIKELIKNEKNIIFGKQYIFNNIDYWYKHDYLIYNNFAPYTKYVDKNVKSTYKDDKKLSNSDMELENYIGINEAKSCISQIKSYYNYKNLTNKFKMPLDPNHKHMIFTGNPGTAKTSVARLYYQILKTSNILSNNSEFVEVGRQDLVGKYVGWTASIVAEKFEEASGGILFIDEAYSLLDSDKGGFGSEAISTIIQCMENDPTVIVIFAGYPKEMKEFVESNPGLKSRIAFYINFPDYSLDECIEIFNKFTNDNKMVVKDERVYEFLRQNISSAMMKENYGNGRYIRNLFNQILMKHAENINKIDMSKIKYSNMTTITYEDTIGISNKYIEIDSKSIGFN